MLRVGLTGGTGSGKSTVARTWAELGAEVVDADALAREVVARGTPGLAAIVAAFGPEIVDENGDLRRADLAGVVFADKDALRRLEAITDPLIRDRTEELFAIAAAGDLGVARVVVHDMPLLVERGTAATYHLAVIVDAPVELRVQRLLGRGLAADDARRRIANQAGTAERRAVADVWLDNEGSVDELAAAAEQLWRQRLLPFAQNLAEGRPAAATPLAAAPPGTEDPVEGWPGQAARLSARLEQWTGGSVLGWSAPQIPGPDLLSLRLAPGDDLAASRKGLLALGFVPNEEGHYRSADPGQPASVTLAGVGSGRDCQT